MASNQSSENHHSSDEGRDGRTFQPEHSPPPSTRGRGVRARRRHASPAPARDQAEDPPKPSAAAIIPFSRDTDFVERSDLFQQIQKACAVRGSRTALVGLGGVGKSQLAIEMAYRIRENTSSTSVFWVHASSAARFQQSFQSIASFLDIPGWQGPEANVYQLVHDWLRDERNGKWFIVLDNVDDASFLLETPRAAQTGVTSDESEAAEVPQPLISYLPQCPNGSLLITTRNKSDALKLVEQRSLVMVDPMTKDDALALLQKKLGKQDENEVAELASALEFMPLAIVQAAAFILKRQPRYSVKQYLTDFQKSDSKRTSLLDFDGGQLRRDWEAKNSVIITWQISFNHIRQVRSSAADLLALMSFYDCHGIPEALLQSREHVSPQTDKEGSVSDFVDLGEDDDSGSQSSLGDRFEEDIDILRDYSFISVSPDGSTFEMHRLVQLATRKWLKSYDQLEKWKNVFVKNLSAEFPSGEYETWEQCQTYFPHAKSAATQKPKSQESLKDWASLLEKASNYAYKQGNSVEAEQMAMHSLTARRTVFGLEHEDTLASMTMLGVAYYIGAKLNEAEEIFVETIKTSEKVLGICHPHTLNTKHHLASTYKDQGRWNDAEKLGEEVLASRKKELGEWHLDTLDSMHNLALTYKIQGKWGTAELLFIHMIDIYKTELKLEQHPDLLACMASLVSTYETQGRWDDAEKLGLEVLETMKTKLGLEHPQTLDSMNNLETLYFNQGRYDAAEELGAHVLDICKRVFGNDHLNTINSMGNLAAIYSSQGKVEAAESLEVKVVEMTRKRLGEQHPDTLMSMNNLALTYRNQGRWEDAQELSLKVMQSYKTNLGIDHPYTLKTMANLAATYWDQGRWGDAEELEAEVVQRSMKKLGPEHPDTVMTMGNLSLTYRRQGKLEAAEELSQKVLQIHQKSSGEDHPDYITGMINLAMIQWDLGKWDIAEPLQIQASQKSTEILGESHPDTLSSKALVASNYRKRGKLEDAEKLAEEVLRLRTEKLGEYHASTLKSMDTLAQTYRDQGRLDEAMNLSKDVLQRSRERLGSTHPDSLEFMMTLSSIYLEQYLVPINSDQVKLVRAEVLLMEALKGSKKLGENHPLTLDCKADLAVVYRHWGRLDGAEKLGLDALQGYRERHGEEHPNTLKSLQDLSYVWKDQGRDADAIKALKDCVRLYPQVIGANHPKYISASETLVELETRQLNISKS